jgi:dienelactone hydrolase
LTRDGIEARSEWQTLETAHGEMRTYYASGTRSPRGAVIVLQEAFGVNSHIQSVANRFAANGYLALAPDLFHRFDQQVVSYDDRDTAMGLIARLGPEEIYADVGAALAAADSQAPGLPCSLVGFCFGGRAAFTAACTLDGISAAVAFYGPGIASGPHAMLDHAHGIEARVLLLYGADDPRISADERAATDDALTNAGVNYASHVYPDAGHAFFSDARPTFFRPGPALDAWLRVDMFLSGTGRPN